ncbi:Murein DD-endopeptidase MepM [invertebrate metagenome]|uniref:Murein DD-endopeptidase MepM n=1 Tax=invertebrate metagenome TaxID=1711999 RepID=A0A2H9T8P8_9ZZZZ
MVTRLGKIRFGLFAGVLFLCACFFFLLPVSVFGATQLPRSQLIQGGIYYGQVTPGSKVIYHNKNVRVSGKGYFVLGFGRDVGLVQTYTIVKSSGEKQTVTLRLLPQKYQIQYVKGVAKKYVSPPESIWQRIQRENRQVSIARMHDTSFDSVFNGFGWPVAGPVTGVYGSQRYFNGEPRRPHYGLDIAAKTGTDVHATADGIVRLSNSALYFSGGTIIIDHGYGLSSSYLHLSKVFVKKGQKLKQGDVIGQVGATGRVTGAHLDWRFNWFDQRLDPVALMGKEGRKAINKRLVVR